MKAQLQQVTPWSGRGRTSQICSCNESWPLLDLSTGIWAGAEGLLRQLKDQESGWCTCWEDMSLTRSVPLYNPSRVFAFVHGHSWYRWV